VRVSPRRGRGRIPATELRDEHIHLIKSVAHRARCSITSTTWGHGTWPEVKPVLRHTLAPPDGAGGLVELSWN
jgi:hypothetical protein